MRAKGNNVQNGSASRFDSADGEFCDLWGAAGRTRTIIDATGARTTFIFDNQSRTVMESPRGIRVSLTSCPSQTTVTAAGLSHFAAHVELRVQPPSAPLDVPAAAFLDHSQTKRHVAKAAFKVLRKTSRRLEWLKDVIQQVNVQFLEDLRERRLIFAGDDPDQFADWFQGASRHASVDAIKHEVQKFGMSRTQSIPPGVADTCGIDPAEIAVLRELVRLVHDEIEQISDPTLREVMRDLREEKTTRESARRLGISQSAASRLRKRGRRLIADRLGW